MRVAHITDVHVLVPPTPGQLLSKRLVGTANLYLFGRRGHFTPQVQEALVRDVAAQRPDALICTGDLTAQATPQEFDAAHSLLAPLFSAQPTALIPGNHDTYTGRACREARIERRFSAWTGSGDWPRLHVLGDGVAAVALDACRAGLDSAGWVSPGQLDGLDGALSDPRLDGCFIFVMLHYPLRGRDGGPYGPATRALRNARAVEAALTARADRLGAIVHGHEHHGFRTELPGAGLAILNPGAAGYAWLPQKHRTAHFNVYTIEGGAVTAVERFRYDGALGGFAPEPGGAYATGG